MRVRAGFGPEMSDPQAARPGMRGVSGCRIRRMRAIGEAEPFGRSASDRAPMPGAPCLRCGAGPSAIIGFGLLHDTLNPAHLSILKPYFNAMRMRLGSGQDIADDAARKFSGRLIRFQNDIYRQSRPDLPAGRNARHDLRLLAW